MAKLELLASSPGTGKTSYCIDLFRQEILKSPGGIDSRAYFVLPSREHVGRIQSLLLRDSPGLFNAHVLTIQEISDRFLGGGAGGRPTDSIRRALIADSLAAKDAEGKSLYNYFRESVDLIGFHELLSEAVREFKASLLSVPDFEKRAQPFLKTPVFKSKFHDFSILIKRYDEALRALGLSEPDDQIASLGTLEDASLEPSLVIFDGFYHFSRSQQKLLELVSKWSKKMVVTLTLDSNHKAGDALFFYPSQTRGFLKKIGFEESGGKENHRTTDPALRHMVANVFSPVPLRYEKPAPVAVFSAPSPRAEYEMIAREIRRLYRETSVHFSDFCLVLRSVSGHRAAIESVFSEYGLPVEIHERGKLLESGLVAALHRLLRLVAENWKRDDLVHLAKSSYFRDRLSLAEAVELERAALREGVQEGKAEWQKIGQTAPAGVKPFLEWLFSLDAKISGARSAIAFGAAVDAFLAPYARAKDASVADKAAVRAVGTLLAAGRSRYAEGREAFDAPSFTREFLETIERGLFSQKTRDRNRVQVYDVVMALHKEYKIVFVSDLLEKSFPTAIIEDPLFKDDERRAMNAEDPILEERSWRLTGERYFFYMAISRARERLYLTHSTHDADGRPSLESFFIAEALACFGEKAVRKERRGVSELLPRPTEWESAPDVERGLAQLLQKGTEREFVEALLSEAPIFKKIASIRPMGADLSDPRVKKILSDAKNPFSASSLDSFLICPFRYFAEHSLMLNRPFEGEYALMGTLLHDTLHDYFSALDPATRRSGDYLKDPERLEKTLETIFIEKFEKGPLKNEPLYRRLAWRAGMLGMLKRYARLEIESAEGLVPEHFEYAFGKEGKDFLRVPDETGEILLRGSVDRIDVDAANKTAVVIDYKRSSRKLLSKLKKGEEIQLPLYVLAVKTLLDLNPAGMEHRILKTGQRENPSLSPQQLEEELSKMLERVRSAVRRIRSGEIAVRPKDCAFCEFDAVCRVEQKKGGYGR